MSFLSSDEIRRRFLDFFAERGHTVLPSASLVPENDPTVLFTTAGMHPLVPYLTGMPHPSGSRRLASVQKCLRTGDIEEVGDNRHNTFFEMLGNWSLGDYFKAGSIRWSWQFLTDIELGLGLDPQRLYVTVFAGDTDASQDVESIAIWQECFAAAGIEAGVDQPIKRGGRIFRLGKESNWWGPAGQTGPCGPDTEIYYDLGEGNGTMILEDGMPDLDSGRLLEIWNNVFMQYAKALDGSFSPLATHNVDTGMGLERIVAVLQEVKTPYETDLFVPIMTELWQQLPRQVQHDQKAMRIVADHVRAAVMLVADGVRPSNKDRGYVLRRLLRRAILHTRLDGVSWVEPVITAVTETYATAYPQLVEQCREIVIVVTDEANKFLKTLQAGQKEILKRQDLSGKDAFDLYQSYGFPLELTREYARAEGITIDESQFEAEFRRHQDLSRTASAGQFKSGLADTSEISTRYHTATHLLQAALRQVLGDTVQQKGSNITPERLRFDFSWPEKLTAEQLGAVEALVNQEVKAALPITVATMSPEAARDSGALGFFANKYGDSVTVYTMGDFSKEICTGPHVRSTGEVGRFRIVKEEAVSAGVRRIKAVVE
jgi:alanyl-tRNA synthetase